MQKNERILPTIIPCGDVWTGQEAGAWRASLAAGDFSRAVEGTVIGQRAAPVAYCPTGAGTSRGLILSRTL
jgi:hypothetical protein